MIGRISFDVLDILAGDDRAVILGSLESKLKRTGNCLVFKTGSGLFQFLT
jgi:hypothetical protein